MDRFLYCSENVPLWGIEIKGPIKDHVFKVNEHRLKQFLEMPSEKDVERLLLHEPPSLE